jgi:predicted ribosomally synthesized peptide with nif11-like leader
MSIQGANEALDRLERDEALTTELDSVAKENPEALLDRLHAEGFDFTPDEMREAALDRFGSQLTPEQLDDIAAGGDIDWTVVAVAGGAAGGGALIGAGVVAAVLMVV